MPHANVKRMMRWWIAVILLAAMNTLWGQTTASIIGVISDTSGALVPDCEIKVTNELTGQERRARTDGAGAYLVSLLPLGSYTVEAEASGFKKAIQKGVTLSVQDNVRVDFKLVLGAVSEVITIEGNPSVVETRSSSMGALMDSKRMIDVPLSGRSPASLMVLIPTVTNVDPGARPTSYSVNVNVAGGRNSANNFLLDNARYNSIQYGQGNPLPPPDFLSEFKVTTNAYDAEKGMSSSATIQVVTRSGGNDFHGSLFEFHRDTKLTARNFFAPSTPFLVQNQFGATGGGRIIKNRTFFFGGWQGTKIREAQFNNDAFPATALELAGNFNGSRGGLPNDPETGSPFPNGIIPRSRFDPAAVNYLSKMPAPTSADGRFESLRPRKENGNQLVAKIDHNFSAQNQLSGRYWFSEGELVAPVGNVPFGNSLYRLRFQNLNISNTHTFSPTLINVFSFAWNRKYETSTNLDDLPFRTPREAGVNLPDPITTPYPPAANVSGRFNIAPRIAGVPLRLDNNFDYVDTVTWIKGKSTWRLGGSYLPIRFGPGVASFDNGRFTFNGQFTGNTLADFLIGRPSALQMLREKENHRTYILSFFGQNDYRLSNRLTLNLGVRYHYEEPTYEVDNYSANFLPGFRSQVFPNAPVGLAYVGDPGIPRGIFTKDKNNFAPRIGLAWDLFGDGKTSMRAGYGVFTQPYMNGHSQFISLNQPFLPVFNLSVIPSFAEPFRGSPLGFGILPGDPLAQFNPETRQAVFLLPATGWSVNPDFPNPYTQQYSLSLQRQVAQNTMFEVSYIGNNGRKLSRFYQYNPAVPGPGATTTNTEARRRYHPGQIGSMQRVENGANSAFNALAVVFRKRFSRGYVVDANYTWMKSQDESSIPNGGRYQDSNNLAGEYALADFHRAHAFSLSGVWDLPGVQAGTFGKYVLSGWQLSGLIRLTSGSPFTPFSGRDNSLTANGNDRPNVVGDSKLPSDREKKDVLARYFNTSAFVANPAGQFGNAGRNSLIGPGYANIDAGLFKVFTMPWEGHQLQLRGEFFNLLNRANFNNPDSTLINPAFGRILSAQQARQIQIALKYVF